MNWKYFGVVILGLATFTGCGKGANAKKQPIETVGMPDFPAINDNVFALKGGKQSIGYKSTMLILNPTGSPKLLADVIGASELTRIKAADAKAFIGDEKEFDRLYGDSGTIVSEIKKKQEELQRFPVEAQNRVVPIPLADRQKAAASWFDEASAQQELNSDDHAKLQATFAAYCDAKIVELAAHPVFATLAASGYTERPTPNRLCENYYATRGYFKGESCTNAEYFTCLWQEGVMKSGRMPSQNGKSLAELLQPVFDDKEKTEIFRKILMTDETVSGPYLKKLPPSSAADMVNEAVYKKKTFFYKALTEGKPLPAGGEKICTGLLLDQSYSFMCGSFAKTWKGRKAVDFIGDVELRSALIVVNNHTGLQTISEAVRFFGQRPIENTPQTSNSDYYFQGIATPNIVTQPSIDSLKLSQESINTINNMFLDKVFALSAEDRTKKSQQETELAGLQQDLEFHRKERNRLRDASSEALTKGIEAANAGNVAFGFVAYRMTVTHHSEQLMRAAINFDHYENQIFEGCYDKNNLKSIDCPLELAQSENPGAMIHKGTLTLNPAKGRIEFSMVLNDPDAVGLGYKAKDPASPDYFMELTTDQIKATTLTFELYPNRLQKSLDILTGKALFRRDEALLYEAGISMWEE